MQKLLSRPYSSDKDFYTTSHIRYYVQALRELFLTYIADEAAYQMSMEQFVRGLLNKDFTDSSLTNCHTAKITSKLSQVETRLMGSPMYYCGAESTFYKEERPVIDPDELD